MEQTTIIRIIRIVLIVIVLGLFIWFVIWLFSPNNHPLQKNQPPKLPLNRNNLIMFDLSRTAKLLLQNNTIRLL